MLTFTSSLMTNLNRIKRRDVRTRTTANGTMNSARVMLAWVFSAH